MFAKYLDRKVLMIAATLATMTACSSVDCPVDNSVYTIYQLQKSDGTPDTLLRDTLWIHTTCADGTKKLLLNKLNGGKATGFNLPVSYGQAEDVLSLTLRDDIGNEWIDTIRIQKDNQPHFESVDCKASFFHTVTAVRSTHRMIDTLIVNNAVINYDKSNAHFLLRLKARR